MNDQDFDDIEREMNGGEAPSWDETIARSVLYESLRAIRVSTQVALDLIDQYDTIKGGISEDIDDLKSTLSQMRQDGRLGRGPDAEITRAEAQRLTNACSRLSRSANAGALIRASSDLTRQVSTYIDMMEKVEKLFGAMERERSEDLSSYLTAEQLIIVHGWVHENRLHDQPGWTAH